MSKKDFDDIFKTFKLIVDTQEQENSHIVNIFKKAGIPIVWDKLKFADYSCICCDYDFRDEIVIERKNSINEFCGNLGRGRRRFTNELELAYSKNSKFQLMIEDNTYQDILDGNYIGRSNTNKFAFNSDTDYLSIIATLNSWKFRYNMDYIFIEKEAAANYIKNYFKYYIMEYLKQNKII